MHFEANAAKRFADIDQLPHHYRYEYEQAAIDRGWDDLTF
jgi:hypothetical protein